MSTQPHESELQCGHLAACERIPARTVYESAIADSLPGGYRDHMQRCLDRDDGTIVFVRCAKGCPDLAATQRRGEDLGWSNP